MHIQTKKKDRPEYICHFCKDIIKASSKTEILYRRTWIDGCYDCFVLSIDKATAANFQQKDY